MDNARMFVPGKSLQLGVKQYFSVVDPSKSYKENEVKLRMKMINY
jgi:hypothetical protein